MPSKGHATWLELDRKAILQTIDRVALMTGPAHQLGLVVKGNAYGHGLIEYSLVAAQHPRVVLFFAAFIEEALLLRERGIKKRICALVPADRCLLDEAIARDIELLCPDSSYLPLFAAAAKRVGKPALLHVKIDTGLARLGLGADDVEQFLVQFRAHATWLSVVGVMTHFADVVGEDLSSAYRQQGLFHEVCPLFAALGGFETHSCASGSLFMAGKDQVVRVGTMAYGYWKSPAQRARATASFPQIELQPVMRWKTRILQVKPIKAGTPVGYGHTFVAPHAMVLAVLPVGYADGYPRVLSNSGQVLVRGKPAPLVGRVSMNLMSIDITAIADDGVPIVVGEEVILLGPEPGVTADDLARQTGTINLDILSHIRASIPRFVLF